MDPIGKPAHYSLCMHVELTVVQTCYRLNDFLRYGFEVEDGLMAATPSTIVSANLRTHSLLVAIMFTFHVDIGFA